MCNHVYTENSSGLKQHPWSFPVIRPYSKSSANIVFPTLTTFDLIVLKSSESSYRWMWAAQGLLVSLLLG